MLYLNIMALLYVSIAGATTDPWYSVENIDKLEINILFDESSLNIKSVYHFHLGLFSEILKANPELGLVIAHGGATSFSHVRSRHLHTYLAQRQGVPLDRVFIREDLPKRYDASKGERVLIYLKKLDAKPRVLKKVKKKPPPIVIESDKFVVEPEGRYKKPDVEVIKASVADSPKVERGPSEWFWRLGLGYRDYEFTGRSSFSSYALDFHAGYKMVEGLNFKMDLLGVYPEVSGDLKPEYDVKLGFDTLFNNITLNSRLYHKSNFIWVSDLSEFDTVSDYGISQRLGFGILNFNKNLVKIGFSGEVSFSNNFSKIESANVYSYTTDIQIVFRNSNAMTSVYFTRREYQTASEILNVSIFGVSLSYGF